MPSFSITPARITEPAVGACVCASGSHVCSGNSGTLTANAIAKARKIHRTADQSNGFALVDVSATCCDSAISTRSKSSGGFRSSSARARSSSISAWRGGVDAAARLGLLLRLDGGLLAGHRCGLVVGRHAVLVQEGEADDADEHAAPSRTS